MLVSASLGSEECAFTVGGPESDGVELFGVGGPALRCGDHLCGREFCRVEINAQDYLRLNRQLEVRRMNKMRLCSLLNQATRFMLTHANPVPRKEKIT